MSVGTGPCAIFSLLGAKKNGWNFVATETSDEAIQWAEKNIQANKLESHIKGKKTQGTTRNLTFYILKKFKIDKQRVKLSIICKVN